MDTLESLFIATEGTGQSGTVDYDPLVCDDAFMESVLIDLRYSAVDSKLGVLFDLRTALQLDEGNCGLLILGGVSTFRWDGSLLTGISVARTVVGSSPSLRGNRYSISIYCSPDAICTVEADWAVYHEVSIDGLDDVPPNLGDRVPGAALEGFPQWRSSMRVVYTAVSPDHDA